MEIKITSPDGTTKNISPSDITSHYATEVCKKNGWGIRSGAWNELANSETSSKEFLKEHAEKMFPDSVIEIN